MSNYWVVPVTWEMCGYVSIPKDIAPTLQEAIDKVNLDNDDLALPAESSYVDGSFCATALDVDTVRACYNNGDEDEVDNESDPAEEETLEESVPVVEEEDAEKQMYTFHYHYLDCGKTKRTRSISANSLLDLKLKLFDIAFDKELHKSPDEEPFFIDPYVEVSAEKKSLPFRQFCLSLNKEEPMYFEFKDYCMYNELIANGFAKIIVQGKRAVTANLDENNILTFHNQLSGEDIVSQVQLPNRNPNTVELAIVGARREFFDKLYSVCKPEVYTGYFLCGEKFFATFEGAFRCYYLSVLNDKQKDKNICWDLLEYSKNREKDSFGYDVISL